ncbi:MAG: metallophosphoesterase [Pirellulales bacterium]|nr:metallophosphoesterase [Pirellulales bacterium]
MDRRSFLRGTGASLAFLAMGQFATADEPKKKTEAEAPKKKPPLPFVPGSWTLAILPDTQGYAKRYPGLLRLQTQWIADHRDQYGIAYVLQNGDLTNNNSKLEWDRVDRAFKVLDGVVPYAIVPGNHDYPKCGRGDRNTPINNYFPPSRFESWPSFGGTMEPGHIESSYHRFEAGGKEWLILGLEWGPRDKTLEWADTVLAKYPDRKALVFTHAYLYNDSTRYDWAKKGRRQGASPHAYDIVGGLNDGEEIWQKLIRKHPSVSLVMNGHVLGDGLGFQVSKGDHGNRVNEMLVNFQMREFTGAARMRLLEFLPDGKTVQAKTYSPFYDQFDTDPQSQFVFSVD